MGLDVDEPGRHREPLGLDHLAGRTGQTIGQRDDAPAFDRQIAGDAGMAGAVIQRAAADQDVVHAQA